MRRAVSTAGTYRAALQIFASFISCESKGIEIVTIAMVVQETTDVTHIMSFLACTVLVAHGKDSRGTAAW